MHWWNFFQEGRIICTAPKEKQLKTRLWPQFVALKQNAVLGYSWIVQTDSLKAMWGVNKNHFAVGETANEPETIAGYHHDFLLFICEEASGIEERLFPAIEGATSTGIINVMLLIGNPTRNSGTFYASHNKPIVARDYFRYHVSLDKTTRVSRKWVELMGRKYGKNSPVVKIRCYGDFADSDPMQLLSMEWIERARAADKVKAVVEGSLPEWRISIDVSDGGEDMTVIILSRVYETIRLMVRCKSFSFDKVMASSDTLNSMEQMIASENRLINGSELLRIKKDDLVVIVDSLGVGAGVRDEALRRGYNVVPFKGGEKSSDTDQWRNNRVECYWKLHNAFMYETIIYNDDFLLDDMEWAEYEAHLMMIRKVHGDKIEDVETKRRLVDREGVSPDFADATMMLYTSDEPLNESMLINREYKGYGVVGESIASEEYN
jgi:hypothetical protein